MSGCSKKPSSLVCESTVWSSGVAVACIRQGRFRDERQPFEILGVQEPPVPSPWPRRRLRERRRHRPNPQGSRREHVKGPVSQMGSHVDQKPQVREHARTQLLPSHRTAAVAKQNGERRASVPVPRKVRLQFHASACLTSVTRSGECALILIVLSPATARCDGRYDRGHKRERGNVARVHLCGEPYKRRSIIG